MDEKQIPYVLLAKYFAKQCTPDEIRQIEYWCKEDPAHEALFRKLREQWDSAHRVSRACTIPDKAKVWMKIKQEISQRAKRVPLYSRAALMRVAGIAAIVTLVLGISVVYLIEQTGSWATNPVYDTVVLAPPGQKSQLILPDGTSVWLNSGSRLSYNSHYNVSDRTVELEGEAFFDVKHDQENCFVVKAGRIDVKVHGTAFNVNAYDDEADVAVSLLRGSVSVLSAADQHVLTYLQPDQSAIISKRDLKYNILPCDAETESSWHLNKLKLEGVPANEVWKKLERWYGVHISLQNKAPDNKYWITLKTESLTELLEVVNKLTPIEYKLDGEEVMVRYK